MLLLAPLQSIVLPRSGLPSVRFLGDLIARSPQLINAALAQRGRYCTISAYATVRHDVRLVHVHYATDHHGESDNHLVACTQSVPRYLDTLDAGEWCTLASPADRAGLRSQYWDSAAELIRLLTPHATVTCNRNWLGGYCDICGAVRRS